MKRHMQFCTAPRRAETDSEQNTDVAFLLDIVIGLLQYIGSLKQI